MLRRLLLAAPLLATIREGKTVGPLAIVTSFTILADLAKQIVGGRASVRSLVGPDGDVHTFQPRPSDVREIADADLVIQNGLFLEPWLDQILRSVPARLVVASAGVQTRSLSTAHEAAIDPHIWQNPRHAAQMVATIAEAWAAADPPHAIEVRTAASAYGAEILQADAAIERAFEPIPPEKRQVITSHDAFGYYGARYGVTFRAALGLNTESEPTPRDLARLAGQIRRHGIRAVFVENMTDPRIAEALAREAGAIIGGKVYSDSLSPPDGPAPTYLAMLRHNTSLFVAAMARQ